MGMSTIDGVLDGMAYDSTFSVQLRWTLNQPPLGLLYAPSHKQEGVLTVTYN